MFPQLLVMYILGANFVLGVLLFTSLVRSNQRKQACQSRQKNVATRSNCKFVIRFYQ